MNAVWLTVLGSSWLQSPDGTSVVSAAADETLRFWRCFGDSAPAAAKAAKAENAAAMSTSLLRTVNIR